MYLFIYFHSVVSQGHPFQSFFISFYFSFLSSFLSVHLLSVIMAWLKFNCVLDLRKSCIYTLYYKLTFILMCEE